MGDRGCLWYDAGGGWAISKSVQFVCNHAGNYTGARGILGEPDLYENAVFLAIKSFQAGSGNLRG